MSTDRTVSEQFEPLFDYRDGGVSSSSEEQFNDGDSNRARPLSQCVRDAMEDYFDTLGDQEITGLYQMVMREVERPLLLCVLERTGGNQSVAAQILGVSRGTLRKKMREHGL